MSSWWRRPTLQVSEHKEAAQTYQLRHLGRTPSLSNNSNTEMRSEEKLIFVRQKKS